MAQNKIPINLKTSTYEWRRYKQWKSILESEASIRYSLSTAATVDESGLSFALSKDGGTALAALSN